MSIEDIHVRMDGLIAYLLSDGTVIRRAVINELEQLKNMLEEYKAESVEGVAS
ncbi:MAG: hypothetical protein ACE14P_02100 [Methanotrichaceae archaeon]